MEELRDMDTCAYCGDEIIGSGVRLYDQVFCSQECLEAYSEETFDFLEDEEFET
jgi:predicted nucleic acid-binding Zn ribbon protein